MAKEIINVGTSANDGTGDKNRVAFQKTNANFTELYDTKVESIVAGTNITVDNTDPLNPVVSSSGGSGSQDLQSVTDNGNDTTNAITVYKYTDSGIDRVVIYENKITITDTNFAHNLDINANNINSNGNLLYYPNQSGTIALTSDITPSIANLSYTPSPTDGTVNSDTGTDATIPLADGTNAGLLSPSEKAIIATIPNVNTNAVDKITVKLATAINKGQAVYISSANGTNIIVSKASNTTESTSSKTLGLLETTGATNAIVNVITSGLLDGIDTSTATIGDPVWLGVSGNLIFGLANKPVAPAHLVYIGVVSRVSATVGEIIVKVQNGFEMNEIHDFSDTSYTPPIDTDSLMVRDVTNSLWKRLTFANLKIYLSNLYLNKSGDTITGDIGNTSTGYFRVANGTTAQRPVTPLDGMIRYNSNTLRNEFYSNGAWRNMARLEGDTFTGAITATNLSGTNTGDGYNYKNTTPSSTLTGTLTETQLLQVIIPANTFSATDFLKIPLLTFVKIGVNGAAQIRVKITTSPTMGIGNVGQIATYNITATTLFTRINRMFTISAGNILGLSTSASLLTDTVASTVTISSNTFDRTVTQYLYVSATLVNIADSIYMNDIQISNI